ncbi:ATG5 [Candida pseudojiufengensis]|uniref:ATG5 n=1 Tax=Candida pseudojiufengensis TaxID=497109 RepID=UPI002225B40B|nr:ATG5 [Candida pseudojiufengensis]KAI5959572.1 ATG5 [Candida pseudojiufengensis]
MSSIRTIENVIEIKKKLWMGSINLKIVYTNNRNESIEYLIQVFRNSYFPFIYEKLINFFENFITDQDVNFENIWLEYEEVPLKWNYPIGVLYDYLYLPGNYESQSHIWNLTLKIETASQKFPQDYIIPFRNFDENKYEMHLNEIIVNQLKQSSFVINGTSKPIMQLSETNSRKLWKSIKYRNLNEYTYLNKLILKTVKNIPIKLIIPSDGGNMIQLSCSPSITLKEFLNFNCVKLNEIAKPIVHGINVSSLYELKLIEIWEHLKYLDNILYITMMVRS